MMDEEKIAELPDKNTSKNSEAETIKVTASSNKEISQQCSNIKTLIIERNTNAKDCVDPEVLKELYKHNFKGVSEFYEFLQCEKLKGLIKVMSASNNYSESHEKIQETSKTVKLENQLTITSLVEQKALETDENQGLLQHKEMPVVNSIEIEVNNFELQVSTSQPLQQFAERSQVNKTLTTVKENLADSLNGVQNNITIEKTISIDLTQDVEIDGFIGDQIEEEINGKDVKNKGKINKIQSKEDDNSKSYLNNIEPLDNTEGKKSEDGQNYNREALKDTCVASPSHIPDPSEFLKKKPIMGIVDYSKIVCDGSSSFYNNNSNDCTDNSPFHISIPEITKPKTEEQIEFSSSPTFISDAQELDKCLIDKNTTEDSTTVKNKLTTKVAFLSDNSNFYQLSASMVNNEDESVTNEKYKNLDDESSKSQDCNVIVDPDIFKELNECSLEDETKIHSLLESLEPDKNTRLPLKKRRMSVSMKLQEILQDSKKRELISFPATPMISIAEVEALQNKCNFKTIAERKQLPHLPLDYPSTVTIPPIGSCTTTNVATYSPMDYIPSYYTIPPVLLPYNNVAMYEDKNNVAPQNKCSRHPINRPRRTIEKKKKTNKHNKL